MEFSANLNCIHIKTLTESNVFFYRCEINLIFCTDQEKSIDFGGNSIRFLPINVFLLYQVAYGICK
jgi:hypothetical protein